MPVEESQLFDAPETPGHVCAYRAFRNFFVGSPDSSPIRPMISFVEDKENTYSKETRSPGKRSHNGTLTNITPKRLRTSGASPSKSILRNPADPTPRRAMLKDVNVTFQDYRKSISPELSRKSVSVRTKTISVEHARESNSSQPSVDKENLAAKEKPVQFRDPTTESAQPAPAIIRNEPSASFVPFNDALGSFDIKSYMRTTEQEMRKLLKYGQKMREIAKKQEEENTRLRLLLKIAQSENTRLQEQLHGMKIASDPSDNDNNVFGKRTDAQQHLRDTNKGSSRRNDFSGGEINEIKGRSTNSHQKPSIHSRTSTMVSTNGVKSQKSQIMDFPDIPADIEQSHKLFTGSASRRLDTNKAVLSSRKPVSIDLKEDNNVSRLSYKPNTGDMETFYPHTAEGSNMKELGGSILATTAISHIPPDRVAAAKERLRRRTEMRKASAGTNIKDINETVEEHVKSHNVDSVSKRHSTRKSGSVLEGNGSQLDWVGL